MTTHLAPITYSRLDFHAFIYGISTMTVTMSVQVLLLATAIESCIKTHNTNKTQFIDTPLTVIVCRTKTTMTVNVPEAI